MWCMFVCIMLSVRSDNVVYFTEYHPSLVHTCILFGQTYKDVLKFDVSVHYLVCMEVDQSHAQLPHGMICICLTEVATV